jgi:L-alanine-DL-glutamate epimerase-like enolase superfamily enzyme
MFVPEAPGLGVDIVKEKVLKYQKD